MLKESFRLVVLDLPSTRSNIMMWKVLAYLQKIEERNKRLEEKYFV